MAGFNGFWADFFQVDTNFRMSVAWGWVRGGWAEGWGGRWIKHMPQCTLRQKSAMKVATVIPNHSTVLNRCLTVFEANFRSTASSWCPLLVPSIGANCSLVTLQVCKQAIRKSRPVHLGQWKHYA